MTLPDPHNPAQAAAVPPAWPMLTRPQEQLMLRIWWQQNRRPNGWCYESHRSMGQSLGFCTRHVRRLFAQLDARGWLVIRPRKREETVVCRARIPREYGHCEGRTFRAYPGRTNRAGGVGHSEPPSKSSNTPNGSIGGPTPPDLSKTAPLYHPPKVNLWALMAEHQRLEPLLTVPLLLKKLVGQQMVGRVKFRDQMRNVTSCEVRGLPSAQVAVVECAGEQFHWHGEALLKLEFYP